MKFIILLICIVTLLSNFIYIQYGSSPRKKTHDTETLFTYKTPDGTIWINKDKAALQRMRNHYVEESDALINKLEAGKQRVMPYKLLEPEVQEKLLPSYSLKTETQENAQIWNNQYFNYIILNSLIIVSGFSLLYFATFLRQPIMTRRQARKTKSMIFPPEVKHEPIHQNDARLNGPHSLLAQASSGGVVGQVGLVYEKNTKDSVPPRCNATSNNIQLLKKAQDIICEILQIINEYSDNSIVMKSSNLETFTTDQIQKIKASSALDEFLAIESEINKTIPSHFKTARNLIKVKFDELKTLINDFAEDFESITKDNTNFSSQIKSRVLHIEKAIELDTIKEIRKKITHETGTLRKTITRKQKKDAEMIKTLSNKVKTMNDELTSAKEETMVDSLTLLYNRKAFDRKLREAFENNSVIEKAFTLIMADIDYFKKINDDYGHIVGDEALKMVAKTIKKIFRLNDFVARYGGEEFVIMIDIIDGQYVRNVCERFRSEVETMNFKADNETIPISISLGIAFYKKSDTPETLLNRADKALYLAKQSGRNIIKTEEQLPALSEKL
jgi:diguanylate cyclase